MSNLSLADRMPLVCLTKLFDRLHHQAIRKPSQEELRSASKELLQVSDNGQAVLPLSPFNLRDQCFHSTTFFGTHIFSRRPFIAEDHTVLQKLITCSPFWSRWLLGVSRMQGASA